MKLYIDTSDSEKIKVGLDSKIIESDARKEKAQKLLTVIDEELRKQEKRLKDIESVEVNTGPGSFTGLRVGISIANALGWVLGVPVNGQDAKKKPVEPVYK